MDRVFFCVCVCVRACVCFWGGGGFFQLLPYEFRLCLVLVKYFLERKIFSSVWLHYENCCRKYFHVFGSILKMLFSYKFFTRQFNPWQQTSAIKSHNHQNTTTTPPQQQQKSKSHKERDRWVENRWVEDEIARRRDRAAQCNWSDRCDRHDRAARCDQCSAAIDETGATGACDRWTGARGSPSSLSLSPEIILSENRNGNEFPWSRPIFFGQLKLISRKFYFPDQPNTRIYEKAFPEVIFIQNKHNLSF